ncbi:MAG TPA: energy transducer TonB [Vicinamibacteria bacterium]|nr:energy transducer TonB [Vicinamibacteria bacterium]
MNKLVAWLKENFRNDDILSPLTGEAVEPPFFDPSRKRKTEVATAVSYVLVIGGALLLSTILPAPPQLEGVRDLPNLIFVMQPGPGGGGGGGGEQAEEPPSVQKIEGEDLAKVAVNTEAPKEELIYDDPEKPNEIEDKPPEEETAPEILAPVVAQAPDELDQKGILDGMEQLLDSAGSGNGGGAGTGEGTGIGEGQGSGLGEGYGGGFGGGAYRLGSGITTPIVVRQVQPQFTDEALARKIEGEVVVEVVILKDGSVQPLRVLHGLSADLNSKALEAAALWKFIPGKLQGQPVDVIAEIIVSFNIL